MKRNASDFPSRIWLVAVSVGLVLPLSAMIQFDFVRLAYGQPQDSAEAIVEPPVLVPPNGADAANAPGATDAVVDRQPAGDAAGNAKVDVGTDDFNQATEPSATPKGTEPPATEPPLKAQTSRLDNLLKDWKDPRFVFFVTGRQHGYMEPCGCTGLEKAKGGLSRRFTMLKNIKARGWNVIPIDVGNQVRRFGKQADIKFQRTADILKRMNYAAVGFGPDDLRLSLDGLLAPVAESKNFVSSNVSLLGLNRSFRVIRSPKDGPKFSLIGMTGILGLAEQKLINRNDEDLVILTPAEGIKSAMAKFEQAKTTFNVLLANASVAETKQLVGSFPGAFDLVVTAGGAGEPTLEPATVPGSKSKIIQVGTKGMYVGLVGVFENPADPKKPIVRYARATLDAEFADSPEVLEIFADYQSQLEIQGLDGLGVRPVKHPSGNRFVGHDKCAECHTTAADIFEKTPHHHATTSLIDPPNSRSHIPRHFDPECLSCHVTGWEPQKYLPYESGYMNVTQSTVHTNGCENCHGPGSAHAEAEDGGFDDAEVEKRRAQMRLTLEEAKKTKCYTCHDIDNSPDFDFDTYWEKVKHYGKD